MVGNPFMSLESGKWVAHVKAIVSGKIVETREGIGWESTIISEDPHGEGWFAKVGPAGEPAGLTKAADWSSIATIPLSRLAGRLFTSAFSRRPSAPIKN